MLQVGEPVPDFALHSDTAGVVKSTDLRGKRFVLYFYPKDDTSGCTMEACSFRDNLPNFSSLDVPVYGISPDDIHSHEKFRHKFNLTFPLLADPEHKTAEEFGVWVEKHNYGKTYMGVQRSTFVVGPAGRIEHVWPKVNPADHAKEVLSYLRSESVAQPVPLPVIEQAPAVPMEQNTMMSTEMLIEPNVPEPEPIIIVMETTAEEVMPMPEAPPPTAKKATKKTASKKVAAKKAPAKKAAVKKTATKKTASKKTAAKKGAAKNAAKKAAKKTAAKKATKKTAAKKTSR